MKKKETKKKQIIGWVPAVFAVDENVKITELARAAFLLGLQIDFKTFPKKKKKRKK